MAFLNHSSSLTFILLRLMLCLHCSCARNLPLNHLNQHEHDPGTKVKSMLTDIDPNELDIKLKSILSESDPVDPYNPDSKLKSILPESDQNDVSVKGGVVIPVTTYLPGCHNTYGCQEIWRPPICKTCEPCHGPPGSCPCPCGEGGAADMDRIKTESNYKSQEDEMHSADAPMAAMIDGSNDHF